MALEKMWSQKRGLPVDVPLISEIEVNKMNKIILATPPRIKAKRVDTQSPSPRPSYTQSPSPRPSYTQSPSPRPSSSPSPRKRGTYNKVLPPQKFLMCQHAVKYGVIPTIRDRKYVGWRVAAGSLRGWLVLYRKAKTVLGRAPKDALESGLVPTKRGPKTMFGEENKTKLVSYLKNLRKSGSDVNRYTTGCAVAAYYKATNQSHYLKEFGGRIDPYSRGCVQELWRKCGFKKRKKTRKRRGKLGFNGGYIASRYKLRVLLMKRKYAIHDCMEFNADETNVSLVPSSGYTMDTRGVKHVEGERLDEKRNVTCFLGGARTGEAMKCQYLSKGTTARCHPKPDVIPQNMYLDHTYNTWSDPESTKRFAEDCIIPFKAKQAQKYNISPTTHALLKWDIYYTHLEDEAIDALEKMNIHVAIVPPNMTDDLQEMDVSVNKPFKDQLRDQFTRDRNKKSMDMIAKGFDASDIHYDYSMSSLKDKHMMWVSRSWNSMIENRYKEFNKDKSIDEDWVRFVDEDEEKEERIIGRKQKQKQKRGRKRKRKTHDGYEVRPNQKEIGFYRERLSRKKLLLDKVVKKLPDMEKRENKTVSKKKDKNKKRKAKTKAKRKTKPKGNTNTNNKRKNACDGSSSSDDDVPLIRRKGNTNTNNKRKNACDGSSSSDDDAPLPLIRRRARKSVPTLAALEEYSSDDDDPIIRPRSRKRRRLQ
eukprot:186195_1